MKIMPNASKAETNKHYNDAMKHSIPIRLNSVCTDIDLNNFQ